MHTAPNILFLMTDQLRWDYMGYAGGPARTPNLDRLAEQGVTFDHCFTPCPICAPARISLATGLQAGRVAPYSNTSIMPNSAPTYYQRLRDAGYRVACVGKLDLAKSLGSQCLDGRSPRAYMWGFTDPLEVEGKWMGGAKPHAFGPYTRDLDARGLQAPFCEDYRSRAQAGFIAGSYPSILPDELFIETWIGNRTVEWLRQVDDDLPWHMFVSFVGPHDPFDPPAKFVEPYAKAPMPDVITGDDEGKPNWVRQRIARHRAREAGGDPAQAQRHYCGAIEAIDEAVGRILTVLVERGWLEDTYIIFSSDHGENLGDHDTWEKQLAYDCSIRVPLFVSGPGVEGERHSNALVELQDLNPTICDIAGLPPQPNLDAQSLLPLLRGDKRGHRDHIYTMMPNFQCLRTATHKLVVNHNDKSELYDLEADPQERHNIVDDDHDTEVQLYRQLVQRQRLGTWQR